MKRRRVARIVGVAVVTAVAMIVSGCGVPSHSKPIVDGDVRATTTQDNGGVAPVPAVNTFYQSAREFIESGYLTATAAQINAVTQDAAVRAFMAPDTTWRPPPASRTKLQTITVIRVVGVAAQESVALGYQVTESVQVVGVFDPTVGSISPAPPAVQAIHSLRFVVSGDGTNYRLESAPSGYFMMDSALEEAYAAQTVYFLSATSAGGLIPDLRYVAKWQAPKVQARQVVTWILNGPPTWMQAIAKKSVPDGVGLADPTITVSRGAFVVNLSATTMSPQDQTDFVNEVRWSLGSIQADASNSSDVSTTPQLVDLEIANRSVPVGTLSGSGSNQAANRVDNPTAYAINGGKVQAIGAGTTNGGVAAFGPNPPRDDAAPALASPTNKSVLVAAIHEDTKTQQVEVALVKPGPAGEELWVTRNGGSDKVVYTQVDLPATTFLRPVWLTQAAGALAVVADGHLYVIDKLNHAERVATTASFNSPITAFSVGQDGYHIAIVAAGQVWIALLSPDGSSSLTLPVPINLQPNLYRIDAVAWDGIDQLVVAGSSSPTQDDGSVIETKSDGHFYVLQPELRSSGYNTSIISQLVCYPPNPLYTSLVTAPVMLQTSTYAYSGRAGLTRLGSLKNPFFAD